jgi:hypothetical protein
MIANGRDDVKIGEGKGKWRVAVAGDEIHSLRRRKVPCREISSTD